MRRCLGDAVANGEHKRWRRNKTDKAPNAFSAKAQFRVVLIRTQTSRILSFFSEKENCDLSVNSLATLTTTTRKNKPVFMAETLEELDTHLLHVSLACAHTLRCGANISALIATGDSWLFKLSTGAGDTLFVQVISHASFNTVKCQ